MSSKNPWDDDSDIDTQWKENSKKHSRKKVINENWNTLDYLKYFWNLFFGSDNATNDETDEDNSDKNDKGNESSSKILQSVILLILVLYFCSGFYQVQHDERGVVLRFGKWVRTVGPGLQYVLPYPFEEAILQKVTSVKQIDIGSFFKNQQEESLMLTGDSNLANISFSVLWKVRETAVEDYLFNAKNPEITVAAVAESVMREIVGQQLFSFVQTEGRGEVQKLAKENLQALMDEYKMGVDILRVELQRVEPPLSVVDAFRDVERAQAEQQSEKNRAEAYDRDTKARTRGLVAEKINHGESMKRAIIENAKGSVARFLSAYSQYKLAPDIVSKRLYIDTMKDIYKDINKVIVDENIKTLQYLPLGELFNKKESQEIGESSLSSQLAISQQSNIHNIQHDIQELDKKGN